MVTTTGSIDVAASGNEGGTTNTATGELIRERTAVARYNAKTENLEFAVAELARKMLKIKAESLEDGEMVPVFVRGKWREVKAELYKKFLDKYMITVRSGSMNVQNSITERNNAIALLNIIRQAKQDGMEAELEEGYRKLLGTFADVDVDKVFPRKIESLLPAPQEGVPQQGGPQGNLPQLTPETIGASPEVEAQQAQGEPPQVGPQGALDANLI